MIVSLATYKNIYLNFYVNFLHGWNYRTKSKSMHNSSMQYQVNDHDLPEDDGGQKTILFATYKLKKSFISRCNFSISVQRHIDDFDLLKFSQGKSDVIDCKYSRIYFMDRDAQEVVITQAYNNKIITTKVVMWNELPEIWIAALAEGDSVENFTIAEGLFSRIFRIKNN